MRRFFRQPLIDTLVCLEPIVRGSHPGKAMGPTLLALVVTWFLYVPVHELLHVGGCVWTGGEVSRLELSPRYGGTILAKYFDFIESGSDYAGQLTGFDTKGNDAIYLATDFAPFVLSVLFGVPLIRYCARGRHPWLFGVAIVVGLAPFYNMPGDYFEMGSIITTRVLTWITGGATIAYVGIRSDDIFLLIETIIKDPLSLGFEGASQVAIASILALIALVLDVLLAFATYACGVLVATHVFRLETPVLLTVPRRRKRKKPRQADPK